MDMHAYTFDCRSDTTPPITSKFQQRQGYGCARVIVRVRLTLRPRATGRVRVRVRVKDWV